MSKGDAPDPMFQEIIPAKWYITSMDQGKIHREIESIVQQLIHKYRPSKIILFGSAARGEYDKVNDLDFLILKQDVPSRGLDRMRELDDLIDRTAAR